MNDRLKMLEQKGFLPTENEKANITKDSVDHKEVVTVEDIERNFCQSNESCDSVNTLTNEVDISDCERQDIISDYETIIDVASHRKHTQENNDEIMIVGEIYSANGHTSGIRENEHLNWWNSRKSNSAEGLPEKEKNKDEDLTELYATVRKVKKQKDINNENNSVAVATESGDKMSKAEKTNNLLQHDIADHHSNDISKVEEVNESVTEMNVDSYTPVSNISTPPAVPKKVHLQETEDIKDTITKSHSGTKSPSANKKPAAKVVGLQRNSQDVRHKDASYVARYQGKANFVQQQRQKFTKSPLTISDTDTDHNKQVKDDKNEHRVIRSKSPVSFKSSCEEKQSSHQSNGTVENTKNENTKAHSTKTTRAPVPGSKITFNHSPNDDGKVKAEHKKKSPPPVPPRVPIKHSPMQEPDINSNSIKSLEDLIAYNRLQQQKVSYKITPKAAPTPPPKVPETTMVTKTASQRSIIITYL
jgi:hypothetical protein